MKLILDASNNEEYLKNNPDATASYGSNDEDFVPNKNRRIENVYIPPEELEKLRKMYGTVVVQDFSDEYHMSRKEREAMRQQYEKFFILKQKYTKKIRKLDKFVEAYRLCIDIINEFAETNNVYEPDVFRRMAFNGEIRIEGLHFPKFQGRKKKHINWKYVAECIMDKTKNVLDLVNWDTADNTSHVDTVQLSDSEMSNIMKPYTAEEKDRQELNIFQDISGDGVAIRTSKKDRKNLMKVFPAFREQVKNMRAKKDGGDARKRSNIYTLEQEQLDYIKEYDAKYQQGKALGRPKFNGKLDNASVNAYLYAMEQYENETTLVPYNNRYVTKEEYEYLQVKELLEASGYNLRNLYDNKEREKKLQKAKKEDLKRIKQLRRMLAKVQERSEEREANALGGVNSTKKGKKGKKSKKQKKASKKMDEVILDAVTEEEENFKAYKKRMENMKWGV